MSLLQGIVVAPLALLLCAAAHGKDLYKIVGPDGRITYTDRAPAADGSGKVSAITQGGTPVAAGTLPPELQPIVARWPVTLFTSADCSPCEEARRMLRTRGVPHTERTVQSVEDREAWADLVGGAESPALRIGAQTLRGLDATKWNEYLDAAGYPRTSRLPVTYKHADAQPLAPRKSPDASAVPVQRPAAQPGEDGAPAPGGFRF